MKEKPDFTDDELKAILRALRLYKFENQSKYQKMMSVYPIESLQKIDREIDLVRSAQLKIDKYQNQ